MEFIIIKKVVGDKMQIRIYGGYEFCDASDCCVENGDLTILYDVPKSWVNWDEEKRQEWLIFNVQTVKRLLLIQTNWRSKYEIYNL